VKPGVYVTFDVECGMGGAWENPAARPVPPSRGMMGEYGRRRMGVPLLADILNEFGLAGTFFVEPFNDELGYPGQTEPVCTLLLDRGQDVQLHVHPVHRLYALRREGRDVPHTDDLPDLPEEQVRQMLAEGAERLARWTGRAPVAFRAGNMAASEEVLRQLPGAGIRLDSSYAFPYAAGPGRFRPQEPYNGSKWYGEVLELALSGFTQPRWPGLRPAKPLDLVGISFAECREAVRRICLSGADAVVILHSFSLFKVRNVQYDSGRLNRIVLGRFRRLCGWLREHAGQFPARTFSDLARAVAAGEYEPRAVPPCRLGAARALLRKAVQALNRPYWT